MNKFYLISIMALFSYHTIHSITNTARQDVFVMPNLRDEIDRKNRIQNNYNQLINILTTDPIYQKAINKLDFDAKKIEFERQLNVVNDLILKAQRNPNDIVLLRTLQVNNNNLEAAYSRIENIKKDLDLKLFNQLD